MGPLSANVKIPPVDPRGALQPKQENWRRDDADADLARYPRRPFFKERSVWAIFVFRFGRRVSKQKPGLTLYVSLKIYWIMFRIVEAFTKISLHLNSSIGAWLRIYHF
jgi:serine O-acetyltransferase